MNKTVFVDFDGTFADHGWIPPGHLEVVREARAAGNLVFLCTGRPKVMVPRRVREGVFDGLVCTAGCYVELGGEVLSDIRFPAGLAARTTAVLISQDVSFVLEAPAALFSSVSAAERVRALFTSPSWPGDPQDGTDELLAALHASDDLTGCSFAKVAIFDSALSVTTLAALIGPEVGDLPDSVTDLSGHAGELFLRGMDKSVGIAVVEERLGLRRSDVIAIGDGANDLEMLAYAGTGVAVQDAPQEVRAAAQLIVPGPAEAGLVRAFAELGLAG